MEEKASEQLLKWSGSGYLTFPGKDRDKPGYRVQKMWGEFKRQIEKERNLEKLFTNSHRDANGQRFYALRLRPDEKQILARLCLRPTSREST
jgi:hypothetical protein